MRADDPHTAAAALSRRLTARRGVRSQERYVAWCDEAIASIAAIAATGQASRTGRRDNGGERTLSQGSDA